MPSATSLIVDKPTKEHRRLVAEAGATILQADLDSLGCTAFGTATVDDLARSGLAANTLVENLLRTASGEELGELLGMPGGQRFVPGEGLVIPYLGVDGKPQLDGRGLNLQGLRLYGAAQDVCRPRGEKLSPVYRAAPGASTGIYIPAAVREAAMAGTTVAELIVTAGEKKALAITQEGRLAVALPGATRWANPLARQATRAEGADEPMSEDTPLHPTLMAVLSALDVQKVLVVADSDARTEPAVRKSMSKLARAIRKQVGARASYFAVPALADESGKRVRTGLDDWLVRAGRVCVLAQLQHAFDSIPERRDSAGGYEALGYRGTDSVVWSHARQCIVKLTPRDLSENNLLVAVGAGWAQEHYAYVTDAGARRLDVSALRQDILDACQLQGHYDERSVRGAGIWRVEDGLVVNAGDRIWHSEGHSVPRVSAGKVYPAGRKVDIDPSTALATAADMEALQAALKGWNFLCPDDRWLLMGWLFVATLVGSLEQRPNLILTGAKGCGKTELQYLVAELLGASAIAADGKSTAAGMRQSLGSDALALIIDEFEGGGASDPAAQRVQHVVDMLRSAYSAREASAGVLRGSADGRPQSYSIRTCALLSMVVPPRLESADESRIAVIRLGALAEGAQVPMLARDTQKVKALGQRLRRLAVDRYPAFSPSMCSLREVMLARGDSGRFIGTIGTLLVGAWLLLERRVMSEADAEGLLSRCTVAAHRERVSESTDERDCVSWLLGCLVRAGIDGLSSEVTISELLGAAGAGNREAARLLERYGLKLSQNGEELQVAASPNAEGVRKLFKESKFAGGGHASVIRRIPGAREVTPRLCGTSVRAIAVPMTYVRADDTAPTASGAGDGVQASLWP